MDLAGELLLRFTQRRHSANGEKLLYRKMPVFLLLHDRVYGEQLIFRIFFRFRLTTTRVRQSCAQVRPSPATALHHAGNELRHHPPCATLCRRDNEFSRRFAPRMRKTVNAFEIVQLSRVLYDMTYIFIYV